MIRRGSILVLAIFFLFVVQLLAFAFVGLLPVELLSAGRTRLDVGASLAAEAGLQYTVAWMEEELRQGREPIKAPAQEVRLSKAVVGWTWTVVARPDAQTPPLGVSNQRVYLLTAEASQQAGGKPYARLRSSVMQESFASYTRFVDSWPATSWVAAGPAQIHGRFHTNDVFHLMVYKDFYAGPHPSHWPSGKTFQGTVTAAGRDPSTPDGVDYRTDSECDPPPFASDKKDVVKARYNALFKGGRQSLRTGVAKVTMPLPTTISHLAESAWGGTPIPGKANHLYLNAGTDGLAGVYISGPVAALELTAPAGISRQHYELVGGNVDVVEVHHGSFQTPGGTKVPQGSTALLGPGAQEQVLAGLPNGVIFAEGGISKLNGTNRGLHTVATRGDIEMAEYGDLYQADVKKPPVGVDYDGKPLPTAAGNALGLVCEHLRVPPFPHYNDNLYLYAAIVAHHEVGPNKGDGKVIVDDWNKDEHHTAKLVLVGSLVEDERTYWASTEVAGGYGAILHHDPHLVNSPPPQFPCTNRLMVRQAVHEAL